MLAIIWSVLLRHLYESRRHQVHDDLISFYCLLKWLKWLTYLMLTCAVLVRAEPIAFRYRQRLAKCSIFITRTSSVAALSSAVWVWWWFSSAAGIYLIFTVYTNIYLVYSSYILSHNAFSCGRRRRQIDNGERTVWQTRSSSRRPSWTKTRVTISDVEQIT